MNLGETRVMAFPRKMVEQIILGLAHRLNRHLIALTGFELPLETRQRFRRQIKRWLDELQSAWSARDAGRGHRVRLLPDGPEGVANGIDRTGALRVLLADGRERLAVAGEPVFLDAAPE